MTKDKDRDDELIGDARKLDEARNLEAIRRSPVIGPGIPFDDMTVFKHYRKLVRTGWQPPAEPEPDRAEVLAGEVISAANIVSYDGYYELDEEAVTTIIRRHFAELRAEWEAERPAVVVPNEEQIKQIVTRFLSWKLPDDFHPDDGISFEPFFNIEWNAKQGKPPQRRTPTGTNLFNHTQALAMVRYIIDGAKGGE